MLKLKQACSCGVLHICGMLLQAQILDPSVRRCASPCNATTAHADSNVAKLSQG